MTEFKKNGTLALGNQLFLNINFFINCKYDSNEENMLTLRVELVAESPGGFGFLSHPL